MIVFTKDITNNLHYGFNNNTIEFYTDSGILPTRAVIEVNNAVLTLYPSPSGVFSFNFKEIISTLINTDNYIDDLVVAPLTSLVYDWSKIFLETEIIISILLVNDTIEYATTKTPSFLSAYRNLRNNRTLENIDLLQNGYRVKRWDRLPFDVTILNNKTNLTIALVPYTTDLWNVTRYVPYLLADGINVLRVNNSFDLVVENIADYCVGGIYIKWINSLGGWNYWYFAKGNENKKTKSLGSIFNDYFDFENTTSPYVSLGKSSGNTIKVQERNTTYKDLLSDLLDSAKVYLYDNEKWIEINLTDGDYRIENSRSDIYTFNFKFELPENITRTL